MPNTQKSVKSKITDDDIQTAKIKGFIDYDSEEEEMRELAKEDPDSPYLQDYIAEKKEVPELPDDRKIKKNNLCFYTTKIETSDIYRHTGSIQPSPYITLLDALKSGHEPIVYEETQSSSHIKLFLDFDDFRTKAEWNPYYVTGWEGKKKLSNKKRLQCMEFEKTLNNFYSLFWNSLVEGLSRNWKHFNVELIKGFEYLQRIKNSKNESIITGLKRSAVKQISDKACVSLKIDDRDRVLGVHITFPNIILHRRSFDQLKHIINVMKREHDDDNPFIKCLDIQLFKKQPRLRTIYSLKVTEDICQHGHYGNEYPCECVKYKIYLPMKTDFEKDNDTKDMTLERKKQHELKHFYTNVTEKDIENCIHFELKEIITKYDVQKLEIIERQNTDSNLEGNIHNQRKLAAIIPHLDFGNHSHRYKLSRFVHLHRGDLTTLERWFKENGATHHIEKEIECAWKSWDNKDRIDDNYLRFHWGHLYNCIKEKNEIAAKHWLQEWSKISREELDEMKTDIEKLIDRFDHNEIAKNFYTAYPDDFLYCNEDWFVYDKNTGIWIKEESFIVKLSDHYKPLIDEHITGLQSELDNLSKDDDKDVKNGLYLRLREAKKARKDIGTVSFRECITKELRQSKFYGNNEIIFNSDPSLLSFKNKVYDTKIGEARERKQDDYLTCRLKIDYEDADADMLEKIKWVKENIFDAIFCETSEEISKFFGYALTGLMQYRTNILFCKGIPYTAKTTIAEIFEKCLPIYFTNLGQDTFNLDDKGWDKYMMLLHNNPIRLAFIDEMKKVHLDLDRLKIFPQGKLTIKPLYKHAIEFRHQCKLYIASNHEYQFKQPNVEGVDKGVTRRGLYVETKYTYKPKSEYDSDIQKIKLSLKKYKNDKDQDYYNKQLAKKTKYMRLGDENFVDKFDDPLWKQAFIHYLLPYAKIAHQSLELSQLRRNFIAVCSESDRMQNLIDDYYEITNNDEDRVSKLEMANKYKHIYEVEISEEKILSEGKRVGLDYQRLKRKNGHRGVFVGIKLIQGNDSDSENE